MAINSSLANEIIRMVKTDQEMRTSGEWNWDIDPKHTARMKEIVAQFGWPGKTLVGDEAADGAWLLVQHADKDPEFQKAMLELIIDATERGEAEKRHVAYLTDRVRVNFGQPQVFGTQFWSDETGHAEARPIEDVEHLDERRVAYGLEPFSEYEQRMLRKIPHTKIK